MFNISDKQTLSLEQFLAGRADPERERVAQIFEPLSRLREQIERTFPPIDGMPDLRVRTHSNWEETGVLDMAQVIYLSDGLIERCFQMDAEAASCRDVPIARPFGRSSVAVVTLMWAYAHEVTDFLRRHALVEKHFGTDQATMHALEMDADLCSVAAIFRLVLREGRCTNWLQAKQAVLANIFWVLRREIELKGWDQSSGTSHHHPSSRLLTIIKKLAMMHADSPDVECERPETMLHLTALMSLTRRLERRWMERFSKNANSPWEQFVIDDVDRLETRQMHLRWDEVAILINYFSAISRRDVDNESSIAFVLDELPYPHISTPREGRSDSSVGAHSKRP